MLTATNSPTLARVARETPIEEILAVVDRDGGVIIEAFVSADIVSAFNADVDAALSALSAGTPHSDIPPDHHGENTKRLCNLITISPTFREQIITDELMLDLAERMLTRWSDSVWMSTAQLIEIGPGNARQPLHRDHGNYPVFRPLGAAGPEVMINFLIAFTDFTEENGATRVIPGSHLWDDFEDLEEARDQARTIPALLNAGDALLISGKVVHGGGANVTTDEYRRGLAVPFNLGYLVPEEAYPFLVPMEVAKTLPPRIQQLIGFRSFHNRRAGGGSLWQDNYGELASTLGL